MFLYIGIHSSQNTFRGKKTTTILLSVQWNVLLKIHNDFYHKIVSLGKKGAASGNLE